jgi:hypothetical protein
MSPLTNYPSTRLKFLVLLERVKRNIINGGVRDNDK